MSEASDEAANLRVAVDETGSQAVREVRSVIVPMDRYEVVVRVAADGRFLGIAEIRMRKDFRTLKQQLASAVYQDVERFYKE